ncbi:MAG: BatA domain-containing protein [Planctomycetota bacterium]
MTFLFPALATAGLALASVPIVIHLLSRLRRRVVPWGAMDFLLASQKHSRFVVHLSEAALLAARVGAIAMAGALVAGPQRADPLLLLGTDGSRDVVVVVDDSPSMGELPAERSPWRDAMRVADRLVKQAAEQQRSVTFLRHSDHFLEADLDLTRHSGELALRAMVDSGPTELASPGVAALTRLADEPATENGGAVVWLSDFRADDAHAGPHDDAARTLGRLVSAGYRVVICPCGEPTDQANPQVVSLALAPGSHAADTVSTIRAEVRNGGTAPSAATRLDFWANGRAVSEEPIVALAPGQSVDVTTTVRLAAGTNDLEARLPPDALEADNARRAAVIAPVDRLSALRVGSDASDEGRAFAAALAPSDLSTGWRPEVTAGPVLGEEAVRSASAAPVLAILDVPRVESGAIAAFAKRLRSGGGGLIVLGSNAEVSDWVRLFNAEEFAGTELGPVVNIPPRAAAVEVAEHPALRRFATVAAPLLPLTRVEARHRAVIDDDWSVLVRGSAGEPILIARDVGAGRLAVLLTSAASADSRGERWSNLAALPIFPLLVGDLFAWLAEPRLRLHSAIVGEALAGEARRVAPDPDPTAIINGRTRRTGVYAVDAADGSPSRVAVNIDAAEGRLARLSPAELEERFGEGMVVVPASRIDGAVGDVRDLGPHCTAVLLMLLGVERLLSLRGLA